jgi:hypothetical protein
VTGRCPLREQLPSGRPGGDKNPGPFPQVRIAGLCECGTRAIVAARLAPFRSSERALAERGIFSAEFKEEAARMVVETSPLYRPRRP